MKVKEAYTKYKDYNIEVFGKPLDTPTIPFTCLPKDKNLMDCEVVDLRITEKEIKAPVFTLSGEYVKTDTYKGIVSLYVK